MIHSPSIHAKPFYVAFAGSVSAGQAGLAWLSDPTGKPPKCSGAEFVILTADKKMYTFQTPSNWIELEDQFYAIGSGAQYAAGALAAGKTPLEAVKIASKFDSHTGNGFKNFNFDKK